MIKYNIEGKQHGTTSWGPAGKFRIKLPNWSATIALPLWVKQTLNWIWLKPCGTKQMAYIKYYYQ